MDRICQFSTIIFAGNMSALLFVAIMTDYWEYRGFSMEHIRKNLTEKNKTRIYYPSDTDTYISVRHAWDDRAFSPWARKPPGLQRKLYYQPPALLKKFFYTLNMTKYMEIFNGTHNITQTSYWTKVMRFEDEVVLFVEYGNLYRNCDNLEVGVRDRLGITNVAANRCFNFIANFRDIDFIQIQLPAVIHLERAAFAFGLICLVSSVVSVVTGGYGSLARDKHAIISASSSALVSALSLIVAIALFHGKCHLLHRRPFLLGVDAAHKKLLDGARIHHFGWSFVLAWICVVLCFVHSWVWLLKAQNIPEKYALRRRARRDLGRIRQMANYYARDNYDNNALIQD